MRKYIATAALAAAVIAVPVVGFATTRQAAPAAAKKEATSTTAKAAPTHATKGVVKSVDDSTLVITHRDKKGGRDDLHVERVHAQGRRGGRWSAGLGSLHG